LTTQIGTSSSQKPRAAFCLILNPVDKSIKNGRVGIAHLDLVGNAHPTIAQLVFKDRFQPHSVLEPRYSLKFRSPEAGFLTPIAADCHQFLTETRFLSFVPEALSSFQIFKHPFLSAVKSFRDRTP
jgi:hypothetical protein